MLFSLWGCRWDCSPRPQIFRHSRIDFATLFLFLFPLTLSPATAAAAYALFFLPLNTGFFAAFLASFFVFAAATFLKAGEFLRNSGSTISLI